MKCQYCGSTIKNNKVAQRIISEFGGVSAMAEKTGINRQTIYRWTYPKGVHKGTNGIIPVKWHNTIIMAAHRYDIDIEKADLVA